MRGCIVISTLALILLAFVQAVSPAIVETVNGESSVHFGFKTDNGHTRSEHIKYNNTKPTAEEEKTGKEPEKQVEYRGGYSFISADGYEYMVLYKANKNGFQPYVTARKITKKD